MHARSHSHYLQPSKNKTIMIRNKFIYKSACMLLMLAGMTSCNDWLDVQPASQVEDTELFETETGFKEALSGVYSSMLSESTYGKEMTFKAAKTPVTGARIIEYTYSNVSPESSTNGQRFFQFKTAIFALNNDSKSASIDKINLDINKDFGITDASTFNDLGKLLTAQSLISNKMTPIYDEWVKSDYISHIENYSSQFGIDYLSEKVVSINKMVYEYTGGAHGNYATVNSVYSLETGNQLKIADLITDLKNADLIKLIVDKLVKIEGRDANSYFGLDELSLENNNFYLTSKGLVFTWGIYEIGPYAIGETRVLIPTEEIKPYLKDEYKTIFE